MGTKKSDWERVREAPLGSGGQSEVWLVRTPERSNQRKRAVQFLNTYVPSTMGYTTTQEKSVLSAEFFDMVRDYTRPELPVELGAMKEFRLRDDEERSLRRLEQEVSILEQERSGLPKLLGFNLSERWMVTEFFANGTLEDHILEYKGRPDLALKAFRSLVSTVALLHSANIVHRDIKPANIFVRNSHELVLGDFGLVYVPDLAPRVTASGETVGAGDFIPPWGDMGQRLENVEPSFDVYMLGKVLWCMVSGRLVLKREYFGEPENDVTLMFRNDPHIYIINDLLKKCVVERKKACFSSATDLLVAVDTYLEIIKQHGQLLRDGIPRPCHVCGIGLYSRQTHGNADPVYYIRIWNSEDPIDVSTFVAEVWQCDRCHHIQFFGTDTPQKHI